jgi:hypothetical protein
MCLICLSLPATTTLHADKSRIYDMVTGVDENGSVEHLTPVRPQITLSKNEMYHYEILEVFLSGIGRFPGKGFSMRVSRGDQIYPSLGMERDIPFTELNTSLRAVYLPAWNQEEGVYRIELFFNGSPLRTNAPITFKLLRKQVPEVREGLSIVDLEMNQGIHTKSYVDPFGRRTDYSAILEWARFMNADMLWILAGETTSFKERRHDESPWDSGPLNNLHLLEDLAPQYGIEIGAYIMSYYVPGKNGVPERYEPGIGYDADTGDLYRSRHISLASERRLQDIVELARQFQNDPRVEYIGFDFIRTGRVDGYELAEQVVFDTNVITPDGWTQMSASDRIRWFARKIEVEKDPLIIEKWRWWRAHRVAEIIKHVIEEARITKPVWVYTLGWNHGKEHGQDPVMFFDAGVTLDAVMLYEASQGQFARLLKHWNAYFRAGQGNVLVGSCVDYTLLDSDSLSPPGEFFRRNSEASVQVVRDGFVKGIFFHDIARALWGRKGDHNFMDYALAHMSSVYGLKKALNSLDLVVTIQLEQRIPGGVTGSIQCKNTGTRPLQNIDIELISPAFPATISYFRHSDIEGDHEFAINRPDTSSMSLGSLGTFESISVPFLLRNMDHGQRTLLFRVAIDNNRHYYVHENIELVIAESGDEQVARSAHSTRR